jgi:hypothetical protein
MSVEHHTQSGIPAIGKIAWGSHFCHFYVKPAELLGCQVPFFKTGLESNERCLWITADPAGAKAALGKVLPDLAASLERGSLSIVDAGDVAVTNWEEREAEALAAGYEGLRVAGNASCMAQEQAFGEAAVGRRVIGLCSYDLRRCGAGDVFDVIRSHQFTIGRRDEEEWEIVEIVRPKHLT